MDTGDSVFQLSNKLGVQWQAIAAAEDRSADRIQSLNSALSEFTTEDTSVVVFGSLARREFTTGSDLDWALLVDGIADPAHLDAFLAIESYLKKKGIKQPGAEATFGRLVFSHDLINYIGGEDDTNANLTRRMLLLLESVCIGRDDAYRRVVDNVLTRYIVEDYGWMHARNPKGVPRFLQNDIARYWRTLAVDFAYKRKQRAGRGWALRTSKLRLSRKLTYAAGLLMCFSCSTDLLDPSHQQGVDMGQAAVPLVAHLSDYVRMTPLSILACLFLEYDRLLDVGMKMFGAYDEFLAILDDNVRREHLDRLSQADVSTDPDYQRVRELGHAFQEALDSVFFDPERCPDLYNLTKIYGVF